MVFGLAMVSVMLIEKVFEFEREYLLVWVFVLGQQPDMVREQ